MSTQKAPEWMPDAVPTALGWQDPRTGEIVLGVIGLDLTPPVEEEESTPATE